MCEKTLHFMWIPKLYPNPGETTPFCDFFANRNFHKNDLSPKIDCFLQ